MAGDMQTHRFMFAVVVASMAEEVLGLLLMMFVFKLLTMHGFF